MENTFIHFKEDQNQMHKRRRFQVLTTQFNAELGIIIFYVPFKQYVFQCRKGVTLLSNQLIEISNFISNLDENTTKTAKNV